MADSKIKVLCVDDSALIRDLLREIVNAQPDMEVVAVAADPLVARDLIKAHNPDVLTLDVEMPRMTGLDFLERLMRLRPMPVLMVSSLTAEGSEVTLRALELGAVDCVEKPSLGIRAGMMEYGELIAEKIRVAAYANIRRNSSKREEVEPLQSAQVTSEKVVLIGASTGGTEAVRQVLEPLPVNSPGILIAQHMPGGFTRSFAERLDQRCRIVVKEAEHGERILPGHAYIAPGEAHLRLASDGSDYVANVEQAPPINRHRPCVDALFHSAAKTGGRNTIGVLLTGMGKDGAAGLLALRESGASTLAQDEDSCVVFGMPREAVVLGAAADVLPLELMAQRIVELAEASGRAQRI